MDGTDGTDGTEADDEGWLEVSAGCEDSAGLGPQEARSMAKETTKMLFALFIDFLSIFQRA